MEQYQSLMVHTTEADARVLLLSFDYLKIIENLVKVYKI